MISLRTLASRVKSKEPSTDTDHDHGHSDVEFLVGHDKPAAQKKRYLKGWRFAITGGSISIFIVFILNLSFTLWTAANKGFVDGRGILYEGSCDEARNLNILAHLIINLFSTIILGSSNYCMQCLSAPTRAEIDREHAKGGYLDVGISSVRNLRRIGRKRVCLWALLGLSSLPLHLLYNSVIFASIGTNNYMVISINSAFLTAKSPSFESIIGRMPAADWNMTMDLRKAASNGSLERLDNLACIQAYAQDYVSGRSNVLLISTDHNATALPEYYFSDTIGNIAINRNTICAQDMFHWICPDLGSGCQDVCRSHLAQVSSDASQWRPHSQPADVAYCLSQPTPQHCKLQFSLPIVIVVLVMNVVKMLLMIYTIFGLDDTPLLTIGDAIASFLDRADPTTKYCCLMSKFEIKENPLYWHYLQVQSKYPPAKAWTASRVRWSRAVSRTRWWVCGSLILVAIAFCAGFLAWGVVAIRGPKDMASLWAVGLGAVTARTLINWESSGGPIDLVSNVLVANAPQPVLSLIYFIYNGIFTCMLAEREWNQFAQKRTGLRVSDGPRGSQRSVYFLQLPYRFAVPIMILSGVLHWLVSQSIFLAAIETYDGGRQVLYFSSLDLPGRIDRLTCGFSPLAIVFVIGLAALMLLFGVGMGRLRYVAGIPTAGSRSIVLSAACHVEKRTAGDGDEMACKRLQWGVTRPGGGVGYDEIGHCGFSDTAVETPKEFTYYAGWKGMEHEKME